MGLICQWIRGDGGSGMSKNYCENTREVQFTSDLKETSFKRGNKVSCIGHEPGSPGYEAKALSTELSYQITHCFE